MRHTYSLRILVFVEQGIERHKHFDTIDMCFSNHFGNIRNAVARFLARTESRRTDIDGVCSRLYGRKSYLLVASRREQAKR